jgi:hypothetical protein
MTGPLFDTHTGSMSYCCMPRFDVILIVLQSSRIQPESQTVANALSTLALGCSGQPSHFDAASA